MSEKVRVTIRGEVVEFDENEALELRNALFDSLNRLRWRRQDREFAENRKQSIEALEVLSQRFVWKGKIGGDPAAWNVDGRGMIVMMSRMRDLRPGQCPLPHRVVYGRGKVAHLVESGSACLRCGARTTMTGEMKFSSGERLCKTRRKMMICGHPESEVRGRKTQHCRRCVEIARRHDVASARSVRDVADAKLAESGTDPGAREESGS